MMSLLSLIKNFRAPALPLATKQYDERATNQMAGVLRLYFNQLDQLLGQIVEAIGRVSPVAFVGGAVDAFGRARFSQPYTIFDSQNRYQQNGYFDTSLTSGGTTTYLPNESTVQFDVTTASGSEVVRQSLKVFPYQPGKSLLVMNTFAFNAAKDNLRQRVGYFSTENGVFLEQDGLIVYLVRRTYVSGAVVETRIAQTDWNTDKLNGAGASGYTLDVTKTQIFWQDFEWLGVGSVRCGFVIDGQTIIAHQFNNANSLTTVYMTTAILPIRYEITNTGATASVSSMKQICSTVISEGGYEKKVALSVARRTTTVTGISTSFVPLVSIRLASDRLDAVIIPDGYSVLPTTTGDYEVALIKNATLTAASYDTTTFPNVDFDIAATALTGGTIVESSFISQTNQSASPVQGGADYNFDLQLGRTIAGVSDVYTIAVRALSGSQTAIGNMSFWDLT
jgi:hypothetical protein